MHLLEQGHHYSQEIVERLCVRTVTEYNHRCTPLSARPCSTSYADKFIVVPMVHIGINSLKRIILLNMCVNTGALLFYSNYGAFHIVYCCSIAIFKNLRVHQFA